MSFELKQITLHSLNVLVVALTIFVTATLLTYVEDALKIMERPQWLREGVAAISIGLFILDGVLILGMATIAALHLLGSMWKNEKHGDH